MEKPIYTKRKQAVKEAPCPLCKADAGKWCRAANGRVMPYDPRWTVHKLRMVAVHGDNA